MCAAIFTRIFHREAPPFSTGLNRIDEYLLDLKIIPVIPSKENEDRSARLVDFEKERYRQRNIVERVIGWLKEYRRVFSRFEKSAKNFGGMLRLAFTQRYMSVLFG